MKACAKSPLKSIMINGAVINNTFAHLNTRLATELVKARLKGKFAPSKTEPYEKEDVAGRTMVKVPL